MGQLVIPSRCACLSIVARLRRYLLVPVREVAIGVSSLLNAEEPAGVAGSDISSIQSQVRPVVDFCQWVCW